MSLSTDERTEFIQLMSDLGPDCDRTRILRFVADRREQLLNELVVVPGVEQIRAGILRLMPELEVNTSDLANLLGEVRKAIETPYVAPEKHVGPGSLSRHPAWIGLSCLELCQLEEKDEGVALEEAVNLSSAAFAAQGELDSVGLGEVLWAMSEEAESVHWLVTSRRLLFLANDGPFKQLDHRHQVTLLSGMYAAERDPLEAEKLLSTLFDQKVAAETQVHARWVVAHLRLDQGDTDGACSCIEKALLLSQEEENPEVTRKLMAFLSKMRQGRSPVTPSSDQK